ncbi:hypothetical protein CDEST_08685 [Colletotrichum destructivum]|uniref:Oxidoreductase acuF-like C2H2 type zinc-finger domain-containing protein n=1 Tax=Colletotrichum destructivum TaxID=34406 RepID=A0AAX4IKK3_9PEZI|nr:hypothetical protein CDEST_08685 [Colletotrichum destructivum]
MESLQRQRLHGPIGFQDCISADQPREDRSFASRLCEECVKTFRSILKDLPSSSNHLPKDICRSLERSGGSLILWADGHGILCGNLDDALRTSRFLRKTILDLLINVSQTLIDGILPNLNLGDKNAIHAGRLVSAVKDARTSLRKGYASPDSSDDSEDEGSEEFDIIFPSTPNLRTLNDMTDDICFDIECLLDLDPLIKSHFVDPSKRKSIKQEWSSNAMSPNQLYLERVSRSFPDAAQDLVARLVKACWDRLRRVQSKMSQNAAVDEQEFQVRDNTSRPVLSKRVSDFIASSLGTSLGDTASYAETTMFYRQNSDKSMSTCIPPLPAEARRGVPFECVACGERIRISDNSAWKRHLFNDLKPWICYETSCQYGIEPFSSEEAWAQHLASQHGFQSDWHCPLCLEPIGDGKTVALKHLANHLEDISHLALPPGLDSNNESGNEISHAMIPTSKKASQGATGQPDGNGQQSSASRPIRQPKPDVSPKAKSAPIIKAASRLFGSSGKPKALWICVSVMNFSMAFFERLMSRSVNVNSRAFPSAPIHVPLAHTFTVRIALYRK